MADLSIVVEIEESPFLVVKIRLIPDHFNIGILKKMAAAAITRATL